MNINLWVIYRNIYFGHSFRRYTIYANKYIWIFILPKKINFLHTALHLHGIICTFLMWHVPNLKPEIGEHCHIFLRILYCVMHHAIFHNTILLRRHVCYTHGGKEVSPLRRVIQRLLVGDTLHCNILAYPVLYRHLSKISSWGSNTGIIFLPWPRR